MSEEQAHLLFARLPGVAQSRLEALRRALESSGEPAVSVFTIEPACWSLGESAARNALLDSVRTRYAPRTAVVYAIIATDADLSQCARAFGEAKAAKVGQRAFARENGSTSTCLYVGSCKGLADRLNCHLSFGYKGTSALHLCYWASAMDVPIMLACAAYSPQLAADAVQELEDALWDELRPMFGRRGAH